MFFKGKNIVALYAIILQDDRNQAGFISLVEEMIVEVKVREDMHIDLARSDENDVIVQGLNPKGQFPMLLMIQGIFTIAPAVLEKGASENSLYPAMAIVVDESSPRLISNFYIKVNKPVKPTKMFTSREEAIAWLKEQYLLNKNPA